MKAVFTAILFLLAHAFAATTVPSIKTVNGELYLYVPTGSTPKVVFYEASNNTESAPIPLATISDLNALEASLTTKMNALFTSLQASTNSSSAATKIAIAQLNSSISDEVVRAPVVETSISSSLLLETSRARAAETSEASRAGSIESQLSNAVGIQTSRALSVEASLSLSLASEVSRSVSIDSSLGLSLASEISRARAGEADAITRVTQLNQSSSLTIASLALSLSSEASRATTQESSLSVSLASETSRAVNVEGSVSIQLTAEISRSKFTSDAQVTALLSINATLSAGVSLEASRAKSAEALETSRAGSVEGSLSQSIASLTSRATAADASLVQETSRAVGVEASLSAALGREVSRATIVDASLTASIASETSRAQTAEQSLASSVAAEALRAKAAENAINVTVGVLLGTSAANAAPSASYIKLSNPSASDGVYWLRYATGTNVAFQAYIIFSRPDGPWVKALQWNSGVVLNGAASVSPGGAWMTNQINLAAGKLDSGDINVLRASTPLPTLWRVMGGGSTGGATVNDPLMNYGAGTLKIVFTNGPNWGTNAQPLVSQPYDIYLDMSSTGIYTYAYHYVPTQQATCAHTTSIWTSDHDSPVGAGSYQISVAATPYTVMPICWTVGANGWYTNMHPWSGLALNSGGSIQWGTMSFTAASLFFAN